MDIDLHRSRLPSPHPTPCLGSLTSPALPKPGQTAWGLKDMAAKQATGHVGKPTSVNRKRKQFLGMEAHYQLHINKQSTLGPQHKTQ